MKDSRQDESNSLAAVTDDSRVLVEVSKALTGLRYGSIEIMVHDGKVTQIEAKKKIRLN
ncbi:MAG: YezD family protein [Cellvibrionales bacterium]|jgi:hypothetical protein|nr:YezD family protein [Cellvibrionales bacterium]MBK8676088.1 YezD family protein [Cellvibrionales bacterium]HRF88750.1 YezD family protein [Pseudomonadales bacterium]